MKAQDLPMEIFYGKKNLDIWPDSVLHGNLNVLRNRNDHEYKVSRTKTGSVTIFFF